MNSQELTNNILNAIKIIAKKEIEKEKKDYTIIGRIINVDAQEGKYLISYGDIKFFAYSDTAVYGLEDVVYVLIPNGDFSETKFILGKKR